MLTGFPPFDFKQADMIKNAKINREIEYPPDMDPRLKEILSASM